MSNTRDARRPHRTSRGALLIHKLNRGDTDLEGAMRRYLRHAERALDKGEGDQQALIRTAEYVDRIRDELERIGQLESETQDHGGSKER
ncbi:MAG: hypothetical protein ACMG6E_00110 [Candidatus Roizmanbacteria bacterium]